MTTNFYSDDMITDALKRFFSRKAPDRGPHKVEPTPHQPFPNQPGYPEQPGRKPGQSRDHH